MKIFGDYSYYYFIVFLILMFVFCLGSIIGSFLNVVILRAFSNESIVMPPSKCPKCGNRLKWWHNIPILSYVLLRGKCYFCKDKISIQYPIIEFITGILFVIVFIRYGIQINTLFAFTIISILLVLSVTDIKEKVVFDGHTYSLIAIGLIYNLYLTGVEVYEQVNTIVGFPSSPVWFAVNPLANSLLGILLGAIIMEAVARIGYLIAGNRAFGEGDTYIAAGLGSVFGWQNILLILAMSVIIQLLFTLPLFLKKQWLGKHYVTVLSIIMFIVYAVLYNCLFYFTSYLDNSFVMYGAFFGLFAFAVVACWNTLKGLKNREELTFLPFGPALAAAGAMILLTDFQIPLVGNANLNVLLIICSIGFVIGYIIATFISKREAVLGNLHKMSAGLLLALLYLFIYFKSGFSINSLFLLGIITGLVYISIINLKTMQINISSVLLLIWLGVFYNIYLNFPSYTISPIIFSVTGCLIAYATIKGINFMSLRLLNIAAFSSGVPFLCGGLGAIFGWQKFLLILFLSIVIQFIFFLPVYIKKLWKNKNYETVISVIVFLLYAVLFYYLGSFTRFFDGRFVEYLAVLGGFIVIGGITSFKVLNNLKNDKKIIEAPAPVVPTFAIAAAIILLTNFHLW